jgi:hypothetical protein
VSYDFSWEIGTGAAEPGVVESLNVSAAVDGPLQAAFGCRAEGLDGRLAGELLDGLRAAVEANPNMQRLWEIERHCRRHPKTTVRIV